MAVLRRHLFAATWMILSLHASGAGLGAAHVCRERAHTHSGMPAPGCPMHHQQSAPPSEHAAHQAHHQQASSLPPDSSGGARLSCHCSGDALTLFLGQIAILPPLSSHSPFVQAAAINAPLDPPTVDVWSAPPSPPPR